MRVARQLFHGLDLGIAFRKSLVHREVAMEVTRGGSQFDGPLDRKTPLREAAERDQ